jgi:SAM-dependent methyltransferase
MVRLADSAAMNVPRSFAIRESSHRILDPFTPEKLATLGAALRLSPGATMIDLACGKGETLCTWARDHQLTGVGVDLNPPFIEAAEQRAAELGVADRVEFVLDDASAYVAAEPVDVASCCGATWIGGGVTGTLELLARSLRPGGIALIGEPYWRVDPPDQAAVEGSYAQHREDFRSLPGLIEEVGAAGWDLVEMVLADQDSWDRYVAAQWLNLRTWVDAHPDDELADDLREELRTAPVRYARYQREHLGWGIFALMRR